MLADVIKEGYMKDYHRFEDCYIRYGTLREDIGYMVIQAVCIAKLSKSTAAQKAMEGILKAPTDMKTMVMDMRFCSGGYDEAALLIAGCFTGKEYPAYSKQAYGSGYFTSLQNVSVKPNQLRYNGNVIIITGGYTVILLARQCGQKQCINLSGIGIIDAIMFRSSVQFPSGKE